jgi:ABC-type lipoprotein release transport system permease subunit
MTEGRGHHWWALLSAGALLARRRLRADWRLQVAVAFGMLLAAALLSSGIIYSAVLQQAALRHTLLTSAPADVHIRYETYAPPEPRLLQANDDVIRREALSRLDEFLTGYTLYVQTTTFFFQDRPGPTAGANTRPRGPLQSFTGLEAHVRAVEGRLPAASAGALEVVLEPDAAQALGVRVGDTLTLVSAVLTEDGRQLAVRVVGLVEALDPSDEYWFGSRDKLTNQNSGWVWAPMFAEQDALLAAVHSQYPATNVTFQWYLYINKTGVRATQAQKLAVAVEEARGQVRIGIENSTSATDLPAILGSYKNRLVLGRLPLYLVEFLVIGTLMYYLALVASLLAKEREQETSLIKSRGATNSQVAFLAMVEGLFMAVPAVAAGPVLALVLVLVTDRVAAAQLGNSGLFEAAFSWRSYLLGTAGAVLAVGVLTAAALLNARRTIVEVRQGQARPAGPLFFQRRYLDVFALVIVALLWWQTRQQGGFLVQRLGADDLGFNYALLLSPMLALVGAGLVLLRIFPIAAKLLARIVEPVAPLWLSQAVRRLERDPGPPSLVVFLLLLATGLGVMGAAFSASLQRGQTDQVMYQVGADVRVKHTGGAWAMNGTGPASAVAKVTGVAAATDVVRGSGWATTTGFGSDVTLLAVDPATFRQAAWLRADLGLEELARLEASAPSTAPLGIPLPTDARRLTVWASLARPLRGLELAARLRDARGNVFDVNFGPVEQRAWQQFTAEVRPPAPRPPTTGLPPIAYEAPFSLLALTVNLRQGRWVPNAVFFDDLQVVTSSASEPVHALQDASNLRVLRDYGSGSPIVLDTADTNARPGRQALSMAWGTGGSGLRGIQFQESVDAVPVLAHRDFLTRNNMSVGDTATIWAFGAYTPMTVVGTLDYFPTIYPDKESFLVMNLRDLGPFVLFHRATPSFPSGETLVRLAPASGVTSTAVADAIRGAGFWVSDMQSAQTTLTARVLDPLVAAGWTGLLALAFLTVVLASVSGLLLYGYIDARRHQTEFALLRTIGFARTDLTGIVWFNLVVISLVGVLLGSLMGGQLGRWLLPLLEVAEGGRRVTPPMVLETNWTILGLTYGFLALAALCTIVALAWLLSRLDLQRVLRMGEV